jgi:hypothetical protein
MHIVSQKQMNSIRDTLVPALLGSVLSGLGILVFGIYTDFLPALLPAVQSVAPVTFVRIISLLTLLLVLVATVAIIFYARTKSYKPRSLTGKAFGFKWSAELDYSSKREEVAIELQWLCPKHAVFLGIKSAEVPETAYYSLWCAKCNSIHHMQSRGDPVYVQEAEILVRRQILRKLRL